MEEERLMELDKLKSILARNEYPPEIVDKTITKFLAIKAQLENLSKQQEEKEIKWFLKLPYVNRKCEDFAFRLGKTVHEPTSRI